MFRCLLLLLVVNVKVRIEKRTISVTWQPVVDGPLGCCSCSGEQGFGRMSGDDFWWTFR